MAADIPEIYEEYRLDPNFETLADLQNGMVNQTQKKVTYVNIAAGTILELALFAAGPSKNGWSDASVITKIETLDNY